MPRHLRWGEAILVKRTKPEQLDELELAKRQYLAQFRHEGCGGSPEAYVGPARSELGCTGCEQTWSGAGFLYQAVENAEEFQSMVKI